MPKPRTSGPFPSYDEVLECITPERVEYIKASRLMLPHVHGRDIRRAILGMVDADDHGTLVPPLPPALKDKMSVMGEHLEDDFSYNRNHQAACMAICAALDNSSLPPQD